MSKNKLKEVVLAVLESKLAVARKYFEHVPDGPWVIDQESALSIDSIEIHRDEDGSYTFHVQVGHIDGDELRLMPGFMVAELIAQWAPTDVNICEL
jgi:hypothetical protein